MQSWWSHCVICKPLRRSPRALGPTVERMPWCWQWLCKGQTGTWLITSCPTMTFKNKSTTCRRKREFIAAREERQPILGKEAQEQTKQPNVHEKSADSTIWFWRTSSWTSGKRTHHWKPSFCRFKLRFGLVSSAAYAQEVQNISSSTAALYQDLIQPVPPRVLTHVSSSQRV